MPLKLMIPGPIELEKEVLEAMGAPNQPHYGDDWVAIHNDVITMLGRIIHTNGKVFIMPGSGSLAGDAIVQSMFAPGDKVVVGNNGWFGLRLTEILESNGVITIPIISAPDQPLDPAAFDKAIASDPTIVGIAAVHLETSSAVLNPVKEIAAVARAHNKLCLIDAVSSLGGAELYMDEWGIDALYSGSQKGLGGAAGISIGAVNQRAWNAISSQAPRPRSWYLDLRVWQQISEDWADWHPFPVTMPTPTIAGLRVALQSILRDGLDTRLTRYAAMADKLRTGLQAMGMDLFVSPSLMSPVLTAVYCPEGVSAPQLVKWLERERQIKITTGFGPYKERVFRVGHMGGALTLDDIDMLLTAIRQFLSQTALA